MAFSGDLSNINLGDVLQNLMNNNQTGTLIVSVEAGSLVASLDEKSTERFLYFSGGKISMYSAGPGVAVPLGRYLVARRLLREGDLAHLESKRARSITLFSLVSMSGLTDETKLVRAVREFVVDEACDLFMLHKGTFQFAEGEPPKGVFDAEVAAAKLGIEVNDVILEAARRVDELGRAEHVIGGPRDVYVLRRDAVGPIEDKDQQLVAGLMDGRHDLATVVRDSGIGRFRAFKAVAGLVASKRARIMGAEDLIEQAETAHRTGDRLETTRFYRRALDLEHGNVEARRRLAEVLVASGDTQSAAVEYKRVGSILMDRNDRPGAMSAMMKAADLVPSDVDCRERCLNMAIELQEMHQAERIGTRLARKYEEMGLNEKACETYERLLKLSPTDPGLLRLSLAETYVKVGRVKDGVRALKAYASDCTSARRDGEAANALRRVLQIDPSDATAQRRLKEIETGLLERKRERWKWIKRIAVAAAVVAAVCAGVGYEVRARIAFDEANNQAHRLAADGKLDEIPAVFSGVSERHPCSWAGWVARRLDAEYQDAIVRRKLGLAEEAEKAGDPERARGIYEELLVARIRKTPETEQQIGQALLRLRTPAGARRD